MPEWYKIKREKLSPDFHQGIQPTQRITSELCWETPTNGSFRSHSDRSVEAALIQRRDRLSGLSKALYQLAENARCVDRLRRFAIRTYTFTQTASGQHQSKSCL